MRSQAALNYWWAHWRKFCRPKRFRAWLKITMSSSQLHWIVNVNAFYTIYWTLWPSIKRILNVVWKIIAASWIEYMKLWNFVRPSPSPVYLWVFGLSVNALVALNTLFSIKLTMVVWVPFEKKNREKENVVACISSIDLSIWMCFSDFLFFAFLFSHLFSGSCECVWILFVSVL